MGNNRDSSFARPQQTRTTWFLLTILPVSLFLFFTMALYHISNLHHAQKNHAASAISEITALIESHKSHLYARDAKAAELEDRSISSFFSGLASTLGSSAKKVAESIASTMGSGVEKAAESAASDLGLGNITSLISGIFSGNKTIIEKVLGHLATPAKFLGMGLAEGGLTGLGMSTSMGTSATGLDKVALNLGSGLTSTIFSSPEVKSMFSDNSRVQDSSNGGLLGGSSGTVGQAVLALSQGLGSGALTGLKLNTASKGSAFDTTGLNGIAGNFGQGLTSTLLGGLDTSLPSLSHSKGDGPGFLALLKREFKTLDSREKRRLSSALVSTISDAALGLGEGLGSGTAVGLGFQNSSEPIRTANGIEGITKNFAYGLSSSFLTDGTLTTLIALLSKNSSFFANANLAQVAQGLAVGVVSGAGSQVSSLQLISANTSAFDDSIHGAATGFGRGIGAEGAKMVSSVFANGLTKELSLKFKKRGAEPAVVHLVGKSSRARLQRPGKRASTITTNATDVASVVTSHNAFKINPFLQTGVNALGCSGVGGFVGVFLGLQGSKTINVKSKFSLPDQLFIVHNAGNTYAVNPSKGVNSATANGFKVATIVLLGGLHIMFAVGAWFVAIPLLLLLSSVDELGLIFPPSYKTSEGAPLPTPITRRYLFWAAIPTFAITGFVFGVVMVGTSAHMRGAHQISSLLLLILTIASGITHLKHNTDLSRTSPQLPPIIPVLRATTPSKPSKTSVLIYKGLISALFFVALATLLTGFGDLSTLSMCIVQELVTVPGFVAAGMAIMGTWMLAIGVYGLKTWAVSRFTWSKKSLEEIQSEKIPVEEETTTTTTTWDFSGGGGGGGEGRVVVIDDVVFHIASSQVSSPEDFTRVEVVGDGKMVVEEKKKKKSFVVVEK